MSIPFRLWIDFYAQGGRLREFPIFVVVGFDSSFCYKESEELILSYLEGEVFWVESHFAFPRLVEDLLQMGCVVGLFSRFNDHVVYVDLDGIPDLAMEHFVYHSLMIH